MSKPLLTIVDELLELEKKATPGKLSFSFSGDLAKSDKAEYQLIAMSRNHVRELCEAVKAAHKFITIIANDQDYYNSYQFDAEKWLRKYGGGE